jgi:hypothetical protein
MLLEVYPIFQNTGPSPVFFFFNPKRRLFSWVREVTPDDFLKLSSFFTRCWGLSSYLEAPMWLNLEAELLRR